MCRHQMLSIWGRDFTPIDVTFFTPRTFTNEPVLSGPLLRLLPELQLMVLSYIEDQNDQLCLAFTCIYLMRYFEPILYMTPLYPSFKFTHETFYKFYVFTQAFDWCECQEKKLRFLEQLGPPDEQDGESNAFRICLEFMRYRPTRQSFWMAKVDAGQLGETDGLDREKERQAISICVAKWACGANRTCPTCRHVWNDGEACYTDGKTPSPFAMTLPPRAQDLPRVLRL